jgi:Fur family transcriptional regulator, peroxide stress response regulator
MTGKEMIERLREKGFKITPQRLAIIDALIKQRLLHPSAIWVYREAKKRSRTLSLSTVYATLNDFSRYGLIKTLEFDQLENRYEVNMEEHVNLICSRCGKIVDYRDPVAVEKERLEAETGFRVLKTRMEYYGLCRECLVDLAFENNPGKTPRKAP